MGRKMSSVIGCMPAVLLPRGQLWCPFIMFSLFTQSRSAIMQIHTITSSSWPRLLIPEIILFPLLIKNWVFILENWLLNLAEDELQLQNDFKKGPWVAQVMHAKTFQHFSSQVYQKLIMPPPELLLFTGVVNFFFLSNIDWRWTGDRSLFLLCFFCLCNSRKKACKKLKCWKKVMVTFQTSLQLFKGPVT